MHGDLQPWDRTDAFSRHPHRAALEALLVRSILDNTETPPMNDEQFAEIIWKLNAIGGVVNQLAANDDKGAMARDELTGGTYYLKDNQGHLLKEYEEVEWLSFSGVKWLGTVNHIIIQSAGIMVERDDMGPLAQMTAEEIEAKLQEAARKGLEALAAADETS